LVFSRPYSPTPEIKRLGRTLKQWREAFLAYFDTGGSANGGTEALNGRSASSTAASHAGSATSTTTDYARSLSAAGSPAPVFM